LRVEKKKKPSSIKRTKKRKRKKREEKTVRCASDLPVGSGKRGTKSKRKEEKELEHLGGRRKKKWKQLAVGSLSKREKNTKNGEKK